MKVLLLIISLICFVTVHSQASVQVDLPRRIFGLTIDNVGDEQTIIEKLKAIKDSAATTPLPVIRIVLDAKSKPADYFDIIKKIRGRKNTDSPTLAYIMVELIDSFEASKCIKKASGKIDFEESKKCYRKLAVQYFDYKKDSDKFRDYVDLWEIGNEINGEWFGGESNQAARACNSKRPTECNLVLSQMREAYKVFIDEATGTKKAKTSVTFYFNDEGAQPGDHHSYQNPPDRTYAMREWINNGRNFFRDVDYVFISYYEDDNYDNYLMPGGSTVRQPIIPTFDKWAQIFNQISEIYPNAKFGFGEFGPQCHYNPSNSRDNCNLVEDENASTCPDAASEESKAFSKESDSLPKRLCSCCLNNQVPYINRYYTSWDRQIADAIRISNDATTGAKFVGGYFYWHFNPDVIDKFTFIKSYPNSVETPARRMEAERTLNALKDNYRNFLF